MQQIRDHLLSAIQFVQITQGLQNPVAQFSSAHRRDRTVEHGEQAGIAGAAGFDQIEIYLRGGVQHHVIMRRLAP